MNVKLDPIKLAQELIAIPSESSRQTTTPGSHPEKGIVDLLAAICKKNNIDCSTQKALPERDNFIANFPGTGSGTKKILIMAHMDTVSAAKMEHPFDGEIRNGKLWGRGACDDKGPLAAAFSVLVNLASQKTPMAYQVTFAGTVDEECSMSGAKALADKGPWDLIIGLEPTGLQIIKAHKGVYRCHITTSGIAAHSSSAGITNNAIITMHEIMSELQILESRLKIQRHKELGRASLAITQIEGGSSINIIPDHCRISVDIRLLPDQEPSLMSQTIKSLVGWRGEVSEIFRAHGINSDIAAETIQLFMQALTTNDLPTTATTASYATDCSQLSTLGPCIVWGPGHIEQAHQIDEHIELSQIHAAYKVLEDFLTTSDSIQDKI